MLYKSIFEKYSSFSPTATIGGHAIEKDVGPLGEKFDLPVKFKATAHETYSQGARELRKGKIDQSFTKCLALKPQTTVFEQ